ncbi:MAG: GNAT family N-acetyltransferase, partial [Clostridia bacterium]|nr:GNAT family N-acetyltransferase [Clostridia bacterium]
MRRMVENIDCSYFEINVNGCEDKHLWRELSGTTGVFGYATEAVEAFLPVMAKEKGLDKVYGICLQENIASVKV